MGDGAPPANVNIMFTTSTVQAPGTLGSTAAADTLCRERAAAAGLPGTFIAFVSDSTSDLRARLGTARGWVRPDGAPVADTLDSLLATIIFYPPTLDEFTLPIPLQTTSVATATEMGGQFSGLGCTDWTSTTASTTYGIAYAGDLQLVTTGSTGRTCDTPMHLYCVGTDHNTPVAPAPPTGKRAFLYFGFTPGGGLAAADAACAADATMYGIPGSFRALLATTTATAASRFAIAPRYRLDGARFTADFDVIDTPLRLQANGMYASAAVWFGAPTAFSVGTSQSTCMDWTANGNNAPVGTTEFATSETFDSSLQFSCSQALGLYCIED